MKSEKNMTTPKPILGALTNAVSECDKECRHLDRVKVLLEQGANPNEKQDGDWTPIMEVLVHWPFTKNQKLLELLIDYGADLNAKDRQGAPVLFYATRDDMGDVLRFLIDKG